MAVKMRLRREGKKKQPFYRVVVADVRSPRDGRFIEDIGYYQPLRDPSEIKIDRERALYWLRNGVQPTDAVVNLLHIEGTWEEFKPGGGAERQARREARAAKRTERAGARAAEAAAKAAAAETAAAEAAPAEAEETPAEAEAAPAATEETPAEEAAPAEAEETPAEAEAAPAATEETPAEKTEDEEAKSDGD